MDILDMFPDLVSPEPNTGCWLWNGALMDGKYGGVYVDGHRVYAHRLSLELKGGPLGSSQALHACDVHLCVHPDHLFRGDHLDNMLDMARKGRSRSHLTTAQVLEIRALYATGLITQNDLAARFNTGQTTISGIVRRARWQQV